MVMKITQKHRKIALLLVVALVAGVAFKLGYLGEMNLLNRTLASFLPVRHLNDWKLADHSNDWLLKFSSARLKMVGFDKATKWPSSNWLPDWFDPDEIIEWGKDPGLGIRDLHAAGITGQGVAVAIIDQSLLTSHMELTGQDVHEYPAHDMPYEERASMHGTAVASILGGKDIGVAPGSTLHLVEWSNELSVGECFREAAERLLVLNSQLPENERIRCLSCSFVLPMDARAKLEKAGIMVFDVDYYGAGPLTIRPYEDRNDPASWQASSWYTVHPETLFAPEQGRTVAGGYPTTGGLGTPIVDDNYMYSNLPALSWLPPYVMGVVALGLQVDPNLTQEQAWAYLKESGYPYRKGWIINPKGFVELVREYKAG